mmetsp:Transcript_5695/g.13128  ORF Transcript_5695/g.13128 Transcript_5695/m.13128 type:complete len:284 (+) Transcript_5695:1325-2176(+)
MGGRIDRRCKLQVLIFCCELDSLHDNKIVPINLGHLFLLLLHLLFAAQTGSLFLLVPLEARHGLVDHLLHASGALLQLLHLILVGHQALGVSIHQGGKVAEQRMRWLKKVKLRIAAFALRKADQELLAISCHELRSQLDDVRIHGGNVRMIDNVLIWRRWLHCLFLLLAHCEGFELLLLPPLLIFLGLLIDDGLWHFGLGLLHDTGLELLDLVFVVGPVRIVGQQEGKLRVILLTEHSLLKAFSTFSHELCGFIDHTADVRRREDEPHSGIAFLIIWHFAMPM